MRYSLLNFVVCPRCHHDLTCVTLREAPLSSKAARWAPCPRVSPEGACVGPVPAFERATELSALLQRLASPAVDPQRNAAVVVEAGVLTCGACGAWYPVISCIPELLPDHLRDWERDGAWLRETTGALPRELVHNWATFQPGTPANDAGGHYKQAEIAVPSKVTGDDYWDPGYSSPFNARDPDHSWHLIRNFAATQPLLALAPGQAVLDAGSGFCWTTEWLLRGGYEPIGVDICRTYLDIAVARVGTHRPHLLVGDVERLPVRRDSLDAVLAFEAFHHVPNRAAAMREFARVLKMGRTVLLVEPGGAHEHAQVSVEAMASYGTLEQGMELADVMAYAEGSGLRHCQQHFVLRHTGLPIGPDGVRVLSNEVYTLIKGLATRRIQPADRLAPVRLRLRRWAWLVRRWLPETAGGGDGKQIWMQIDGPGTGLEAEGTTTITGWALDPLSPIGSGIGAVHVWAKNTGADSVFLGSAALGDSRPDVAGAFGPRFRASGFTIPVSLGPGRHELTVHAFCDRTVRWEDARTITLTVGISAP